MTSTNYTHTIKKNIQQKNEKYAHASIFWFGAFHQLTVWDFIFGCMAQFPVDTEFKRYCTPKLQIYSKFSKYIMLAKEAIYFTFLRAYALSEVSRCLGVNLTNFHPTLCFSLMLNAVALFRKKSLSNNLTFCKWLHFLHTSSSNWSSMLFTFQWICHLLGHFFLCPFFCQHSSWLHPFNQ